MFFRLQKLRYLTTSLFNTFNFCAIYRTFLDELLEPVRNIPLCLSSNSVLFNWAEKTVSSMACTAVGTDEALVP